MESLTKKTKWNLPEPGESSLKFLPNGNVGDESGGNVEFPGLSCCLFSRHVKVPNAIISAKYKHSPSAAKRVRKSSRLGLNNFDVSVFLSAQMSKFNDEE